MDEKDRFDKGLAVRRAVQRRGAQNVSRLQRRLRCRHRSARARAPPRRRTLRSSHSPRGARNSMNADVAPFVPSGRGGRRFVRFGFNGGVFAENLF